MYREGLSPLDRSKSEGRNIGMRCRALQFIRGGRLRETTLPSSWDGTTYVCIFRTVDAKECLILHHLTYDKLTRQKTVRYGRAVVKQTRLDMVHLGLEEQLDLQVGDEARERAKLNRNTAAENADYLHERGLEKALFQGCWPVIGCTAHRRHWGTSTQLQQCVLIEHVAA